MSSQTVLSKIQCIAEWAVRYRAEGVQGLAQQIDVPFLEEAYRRLNPKSAPGIDGVKWKTYGENLAVNLADLHQRLKTMRYKAQPVKRVWLNKEDGKKRPIGMRALEDKIAERAVVMVLEPIYESLFYDFSYGFRPGRSAHQALPQLREQCNRNRVSWILDADISGFFDNIDHGILMEFLGTMVKDKNILRLIGKWLNSGVIEGTQWSQPGIGTPQGSVISPLLANVFLHYVLDDWFVRVVQPRMKGRIFLVRYADDFVIGFELEEDARKVMEVLPKRFNRFGLTIHPEKTRLIPFGKPHRDEPKGKGGSRTFDFLGFTHYWTKSRRGSWVIKRKTAGKRLRRAKVAMWQWCRKNRHKPIREQAKILASKLRGHYQYYGIRGNYKALETLYKHAQRAWHYWLSRRSTKSYILWNKFAEWWKGWQMPRPRIIHAI